MDINSWIHFGIFLVAIAGAAGAVIKFIGGKVDDRSDKIDFQFSKIDLKFDEVHRQVNEKFGQVTNQIDRLKDLGNDRHIANIERLARLEGQISALPQKVNPQNGDKRG